MNNITKKTIIDIISWIGLNPKYADTQYWIMGSYCPTISDSTPEIIVSTLHKFFTDVFTFSCSDADIFKSIGFQHSILGLCFVAAMRIENYEDDTNSCCDDDIECWAPVSLEQYDTVVREVMKTLADHGYDVGDEWRIYVMA